MRIKDKWYKELLWLAQEYTCEILVTIATLVMFVFIFIALSDVPRA
jgi:hypothetical protein